MDQSKDLFGDEYAKQYLEHKEDFTAWMRALTGKKSVSVKRAAQKGEAVRGQQQLNYP